MTDIATRVLAERQCELDCPPHLDGPGGPTWEIWYRCNGVSRKAFFDNLDDLELAERRFRDVVSAGLGQKG